MPLRLHLLKKYYRRNKLNNSQGLTLVELLVVVMIIAILIAVALPMFYKMIAKAEIQECITTTRHLVDRQNEYYTENLTFTQNIDQLNFTPRDADKYNYSILKIDTSEYKVIAHIGEAKNRLLGFCFSGIYLKNGEPKMCTPNPIWSSAELNENKITEKCQ